MSEDYGERPRTSNPSMKLDGACSFWSYGWCMRSALLCNSLAVCCLSPAQAVGGDQDVTPAKPVIHATIATPLGRPHTRLALDGECQPVVRHKGVWTTECSIAETVVDATHTVCTIERIRVIGVLRFTRDAGGTWSWRDSSACALSTGYVLRLDGDTFGLHRVRSDGRCKQFGAAWDRAQGEDLARFCASPKRKVRRLNRRSCDE